MACKYYDDIIIEKLKRWIPDNSNLRILKPSESKRLFELKANDNKDRPMTLPFIALSRDSDIELELAVKSPKSYDGLKIAQNDKETLQFNVIPIKLAYQLDIYTKTYEEGDEYLRNFIFKLVNNPVIKVTIPYNETNIEHIANIRMATTVSDTSDITERIFSGQFTRWTIQFEIQDAFLFSVPYRKNWKLYLNNNEEILLPGDDLPALEVSERLNEKGELEPIN